MIPRLIIPIAILAIAPQAAAWSSRASKTLHDVLIADAIIAEYRSEFGKLPDEAQFAKMDAALDYPPGMYADLLFDHWHRPLVYRNPGRHGEYDLYSVGQNGIDDGKSEDDIGVEGPREGYYWKHLWPLGRFVVLTGFILGLALYIAAFAKSRHFLRPIAGAVVGGGICAGSLLLLHPGVIPARNHPLLAMSLFGGIICANSLRRIWR